MNPETKTCQNCKQSFVIEPEDFAFYEKMKVPAPTWCPECRFLRRVLWRNEWRLFKKKDALTGRELFTSFPPESFVKIYDRDYWWSDKWDPIVYGRKYDFSRPFFTQLSDLLREVPLYSRSVIGTIVNSDYSMNAGWLKNCYMVFNFNYGEDSAYIVAGAHAKNCFDCHVIYDSELCYESFNLTKCYKTYYSQNCDECTDVILCHDCSGCSNCFGCANLRNKSYCIFNEQFSKNEYERKLGEIWNGSYANVIDFRKRSYQMWQNFPTRYIHGKHNNNVSGEYINNSKNVVGGYRITDTENAKNCQFIIQGPVKDSYDYSIWGAGAELMYESSQSGAGAFHLNFCWQCYPETRDLEYCLMCGSSSHLFACVGLRNKQYCILNKQYTKEEYESLVPRIIAHMNDMPYVDQKGRVYRYGEFFPPELSPFAYNETIAQEYFPLTKAQALAQGYRWKDPDTKEYTITKPPASLPDHIRDVKDDILKETIGCAHANLRTSDVLRLAPTCPHQCTTAFRIIPEELSFYRRMNLPLPRLCPNCRHYERLAQRNPLKLWHRGCQCNGAKSENGVYQNTAKHQHGAGHCPNEFETSYAPERKEIVYCESCYNAEVV